MVPKITCMKANFSVFLLSSLCMHSENWYKQDHTIISTRTQTNCTHFVFEQNMFLHAIEAKLVVCWRAQFIKTSWKWQFWQYLYFSHNNSETMMWYGGNNLNLSKPSYIANHDHKCPQIKAVILMFVCLCLTLCQQLKLYHSKRQSHCDMLKNTISEWYR